MSFLQNSAAPTTFMVVVEHRSKSSRGKALIGLELVIHEKQINYLVVKWKNSHVTEVTNLILEAGNVFSE